MQQYGVTREQLAMCASLMTLQASRHPHALARRPIPVEVGCASSLCIPLQLATTWPRPAAVDTSVARKRLIVPSSSGLTCAGFQPRKD